MSKSDAKIADSLMDSKWVTTKEQGDIHRSATIAMNECFLDIIEGPHQKQSIPITDALMHIGRAEWCDISLPNDLRVSRHHAELQLSEDGIVVRDLGSSNGVHVSGLRVFHGVIQPGNSIQIGDSVLALRVQPNKTKILVNFFDKSGRLVGESQKMQEIFSLLLRVGPTDIPVLIRGETGTGKSSIARSLHEHSSRAKQPFVHVNCGALSPSLVESELFGYEKGAFTNANRRHKGFFEQADKGTLFLDEIGELPIELQPKLLDVLERQKFRRLGGETEVSVDIRLLSATHQQLKDRIKDKTFREDLYYRMAVMELEAPPLRERKEDMELLLGYILAQLATEQNVRISPEALRNLKQRLWPGNVRQLRNEILRSLLFLEGDVIYPSHLTLSESSNPVSSDDTKLQAEEAEEEEPKKPFALLPPDVNKDGDLIGIQERLDIVEKNILIDALQQHNWNIRKTTAYLQVSRSWVYNLLKKYNLKRDD